MTEENKERIVKYWYLQQGVVVNMEKLSASEIDETYDRLMMYTSRIPVKCSIAEVEAVIEVLNNISKLEYATFNTDLGIVVDGHEYKDILQAELAELKQLL